MTVKLQQRQLERSKRASKDQKRRLSPLSLASLSCFSLYLAAGAPQNPTMPGDVMQPMHVSAILSPIDNIASPRAIISEQSPVKKRRVGGAFTFDCEQHRYGSHSRSGSLALLRVLTAPPSPTADLCLSPMFSTPNPPRKTSTHKMKTQPSAAPQQATRSPPRSVQATSSNASTAKPVSQSGTNTAATQHSRSKSNTFSSLPSKNESAPQSPSFAQLTAAKALAGKNAASSMAFLPPTSEESVAAWFNPEASLSSSSTGTLKSKLISLSKGQSLIVVYPTRRGADTFTKRILGPVLDPVLRRAVNEHGLKTESAAEIRNMEAVDSMLDAEALETTVEGVVENVNTETHHGISIRSSNIATVSLPSDFWKHHWINQERQRIRKVVTAGLGNGGGALVEMAGISVPKSAVRVTEEMLEGLKNHKFEDWEARIENDSQAAVEVGVFVLTRK